MYSDDEVFEHALFVPNGGEETLPVHEEADIHELAQKRGCSQRLSEPDKEACHYRGDGLGEYNVVSVVQSLQSNGELVHHVVALL